MEGREDTAPEYGCGAFAVDPGGWRLCRCSCNIPVQRADKGLHAHEAVFLTDAERLQNRLFDGRGNGDAKLGGAFERIAVNPFDGIRRKNSGDAAVKRCTHGINVCPGSLISMGRVLLLRGIAML